MPDSGPAAISGKPDINWKQYAEDALSLFLATSGAVPAAMRVWTTAWTDWMKSAAGTQDQLARRWRSIVREPGRGGAIFNEMREDVKRYYIEIGGIPERAVLDFLTSVSESAGSPDTPAAPGKPASPSLAKALQALDAVVKAASDTATDLEVANELLSKLPGGEPSTRPARDHLAALRKQLAALEATRAELGRSSPPSTP